MKRSVIPVLLLLASARVVFGQFGVSSELSSTVNVTIAGDDLNALKSLPLCTSAEDCFLAYISGVYTVTKQAIFLLLLAHATLLLVDIISVSHFTSICC